MVQAEEETTLLMAHVMGESLATQTTLDQTPSIQEVYLSEEKDKAVELGDEGDEVTTEVWFLDTGATNHMTGACTAFAELDTGVMGSVKFGDGSMVDIRGRSTVLF